MNERMNLNMLLTNITSQNSKLNVSTKNSWQLRRERREPIKTVPVDHNYVGIVQPLLQVRPPTSVLLYS